MTEPAMEGPLPPAVIAAAGWPVLAWKSRAAALALTAAAVRCGARLGQPDGESSRLYAESLARRAYRTPQPRYPGQRRLPGGDVPFPELDVETIEVDIDADFIDVTIPVDIVDLAVVEVEFIVVEPEQQ